LRLATPGAPPPVKPRGKRVKATAGTLEEQAAAVRAYGRKRKT
jgi:hypothetical protein